MLVKEGIHLIDLLLWFMGDLESVYGELQKVGRFHERVHEIEDTALALLSFKNGSKGIVEANALASPAYSGSFIRLFAEKGTIIVGGKQLDHIECFDVKGIRVQDSVLRLWEQDRGEWLRMYEAYFPKIQETAQPEVVDSVEADKALEAIFAIYQSGSEGRKISLPLKDFDIKWMDKGTRH